MTHAHKKAAGFALRMADNWMLWLEICQFCACDAMFMALISSQFCITDSPPVHYSRQERIMRVSAVRRQERDTPTHLIKNCNSTHDGRVSKDRPVITDGTRTYSFVLDRTGLLEGKKQLSTNLGQSCLSASLSRYC